MDECECYIIILKSILKLEKNNKFKLIIPILFNIICPQYYKNRNNIKYNIDNLYKTHLPLLYIYLKNKYVMANKDKLIF